jgi:anti-sigma factor (TIGR02949 family)
MNMDCQSIQQRLHAYADGELDVLQSAEIDAHLAGCPECARSLEAIDQIKIAVANPALYFKAPQPLRERIQSTTSPAKKQAFPWRVLALAACVLLAVSLSLPWILPTHRFLADEIVASHIRSLQANHLFDVESTDQHTVKPWFDGKLDFAPPVRDLAGDGFPLIGGRLDYLDGRPVAALVYRRAKHVINVFIWPGAGGATVTERQGYNLVQFALGDMSCWAVSDLNAAELSHFVQLLQTPPP